MLYILCYPKLAEADAAALEAFRAKHEPARAAMVGAHITLVFGVRQIEQAALIKLTRDIAATTGPFDFAIDGMEVEAHEHGDHNLMLKVGSGRETLIALNSTFYAGALAPERGTIEFVPHITIASNRDLKAVIMAAPEAKPLTTVKGRIEARDVAALSGATLTSLATIPLA